MCSCNQSKDSRIMMSLGMMSLVIALVLRVFFPVIPGLGLNLTHGLQGFFFGFSITLNLASAILARRQRQCEKS